MSISVSCSNKNMFYAVGYWTLKVVFSQFQLWIFILLFLSYWFCFVLPKDVTGIQRYNLSAQKLSQHKRRENENNEQTVQRQISQVYRKNLLERTSIGLLVQPPAPRRTNLKVRLGSPVSNAAKLSTSPRMEILQPLWAYFRPSPCSRQRMIFAFFSTGFSLVTACNCCPL